MSRITDLMVIEYITQSTAPTRHARSAPLACAGSAERHGGPARPMPARTTEGSDAPMTVTVPIVAIVGLIVFIAYRYMGLRALARTRIPAIRFLARGHRCRAANQPRSRRPSSPGSSTNGIPANRKR